MRGFELKSFANGVHGFPKVFLKMKYHLRKAAVKGRTLKSPPGTDFRPPVIFDLRKKAAEGKDIGEM